MEEERRVTKVAWLELREPFETVWNRKAARVDVQEYGTKIYRVGNIVRIDIKDKGEQA